MLVRISAAFRQLILINKYVSINDLIQAFLFILRTVVLATDIRDQYDCRWTNGLYQITYAITYIHSSKWNMFSAHKNYLKPYCFHDHIYSNPNVPQYSLINQTNTLINLA